MTVDVTQLQVAVAVGPSQQALTATAVEVITILSPNVGVLVPPTSGAARRRPVIIAG